MTQCATPTVGKLCLAKRDQSDFSRDTWGCKSSSCHKFALCSGRIRDREEEGEARGGEHDYAIISLCRHTHELQSVFFLALQLLQVALSFQQVLPLLLLLWLQHLRMLRRFSNHFSLIIRQCSRSSSISRPQRPSQRSRSSCLPLCFILLCHCAASLCRRQSTALQLPLRLLLCCRSSLHSLRLSHQYPRLLSLFAALFPSLINILSLLCTVVRSSCSAAAASCPVAAQPLPQPLSPLSLSLSLSSLWQFRGHSFDLAPACLVPLCIAPVVCIQISSLSLPLPSSLAASAAVELSCWLRSIDRRVAAAQGNLNYGCRFGEVLPIHNCNLNWTRLSLAFTGMRDSPHSSLPSSSCRPSPPPLLCSAAD